MWIFRKEHIEVLASTFPFLYLFESTVQVELPPIEMVGIEREIIIFSTVAGVGQNVAAAFSEAEKDMTGTKKSDTSLSYMSQLEQYYTCQSLFWM